jgi:hypothetical protein
VKKDILSILVGVGFTLADQLLGQHRLLQTKNYHAQPQHTIYDHMGRERKRNLFYILRTYYTEDFFVQANWFAMQNTARLHVMFPVGSKQKTF